MSTAPLLPCLVPDALEIRGHSIDLARLIPERHGADLWQAIGSTADLWEQVPPGPFAEKAAFSAWLDARCERPDQVLYALLDKDRARTAVGLYLLINIETAMGRIELGLMLGPRTSQKTSATEAFLLVGRYLFETLGYRRLEWRCDPKNVASVRAARRLGFTQEGVLRQNGWLKGRNWDQAVFSIVDHEWPVRAKRLSRWLEPDNFDPSGRQKKSLSEC